MKKKHPRPPFLQDFCKKAQWRAKKLRERGSSTARPTEKGGGGLPIRSIRSISARRFGRFGRIASRFADFLLAFRPDSVVSRRFGRVGRVASRRFGRASCRFRRVDSVDFGVSRRVDLECCLCRDSVDSVDSAHRGQCRSQGANTKKPDSSIGKSGSAIERRRALLTFR